MVNMWDFIDIADAWLPHQLVGGLQYILGWVAKKSLLISYPIKRNLVRRIETFYQYKMFTSSFSQFRFKLLWRQDIVLGTKILTL